MSKYATKEQLVSIVSDMASKVNMLSSGSLADLSDTTISSPADGQVLAYDSTSGKWKNENAIPDISGKADKVTNATSDNFAKLDANGNLADSGYSANSFMRNIYLEQTVTLSTSAATTVTFTDSSITTTSVIDLAVSEWGLTPDDVTVTTGVCTVVMPKADSAHSVTVRIYVR